MTKNEIESIFSESEIHADVLIEHCDAILILMSVRDDDGSTRMIISRRGNFHATVGLLDDAKQFLFSDENVLEEDE